METKLNKQRVAPNLLYTPYPYAYATYHFSNPDTCRLVIHLPFPFLLNQSIPRLFKCYVYVQVGNTPLTHQDTPMPDRTDEEEDDVIAECEY